MSLTPEFCEMLRRGIGTRTQIQFAKETGLTPEYLSRLLNGKTDAAPRLSTLEKIAVHTSRYGLNDYRKALGEETISARDRLHGDTVALNRYLRSRAGKDGGWRTVTDMIHDRESRPVPGFLKSGVEGRTPDMLRSEFGDTWFHLFQFRIPDREYIGAFYFLLTSRWEGETDIICELVTNTETIEEFLPFSLFGSTEFPLIGNTILYPMTGNKQERETAKQELDAPLGFKGSMEKFFDRILGTEISPELAHGADGKEYQGWRARAVTGFGFRYDIWEKDDTSEFGRTLKTPEKFRAFLMHHAGTFCRTDEEIRLFRQLVDTDEDPREIFFEYHGEYAKQMSADDFDCCGTGAAVATVLSREYQGTIPGGFRFIRTPMGVDSRQPGYILICPNGGEDYTDGDITMKELLPVYSAARELGIPKFGACHAYDRVPELKKTRTYRTDSFHLEF